LTTPNYVKLSENLKESYNVTMLNPLSNDLASMRQSMLFSGLEAISYNINRRNSDLKLFEFGKTYHKFLSGFEELKHLSLFATGNRAAESWTNPQKPTDFFYFKSFVNSVLNRLGLDKSKTQPLANDIFVEGMALSIGNETVVEFGTIKKSILKEFGIKHDVFYADFNWNVVLKAVSTKIKLTDISKFQEVRRDLSLLLDEDIPFEMIYKIAKQSEKTLLKEVDLFDVYQGKNLPEGKKSYAVSFIIQDSTKTLTDDQIDSVMTKLQKNFEKELNASLR
jgi:phenylalanyl-tRNA synthetase beta chain